MNALLKHQILNAAADADQRKLPSLAAVLTDALAELERLAPFEPVTLFVAEPVVARRHEIASEQTDEMMAQAAPNTATTVYSPEFVRNKFADYETQILNLREELAARVGATDAAKGEST